MSKLEKKKNPRVFKTAWFTKNALKAGISNLELCQAIQEMNKGCGKLILAGMSLRKD